MPDQPDMIEVTIDSVRVSLMSPQRIVILRDIAVDRYLPIWVGPYEAEAITVALQEVEISRPMTHDLLKNVFNTFKALLVRVEIQSLKDDVFFGNIVVELDGEIINIDSRPSDAIALAVRAHIPIIATKEVMDKASIVPEEDIQDSGMDLKDKTVEEMNAMRPPEPPTPEEEERLGVFDEFLDDLDIGSTSGEEKEDNPPEPDKT